MGGALFFAVEPDDSLTRLRILFCTDTLSAGGTEQQLVELATRLDRERFDPYVLCLYGERAQRSLHFQRPLAAARIPVQVLDLGWSAADKLHGIAAVARVCRKFQPDVIHAVNYHSVLFTKLAYPFLPRPSRLISSVYVHYTLKQLAYEVFSSPICAAIVCNSPQIQRQLRFCPRVELIVNGTDLARFELGSDPGLRARIAPEARRVLVMLGRISRQKSPHLLAEALGWLKARGELSLDVRVFIIGEVDSLSFRTKLIQTIERYELQEVIRLLPPTNQPEAWYSAADVTILASLWEGLPNVVLELLAAGRPVIVSEAANAAEVVEDGVTGWVVPTGDVVKLAETLRQVLALPDTNLRAMELACRAAAAPFAVEQMVARYTSLYERVASSS